MGSPVGYTIDFKFNQGRKLLGPKVGARKLDSRRGGFVLIKEFREKISANLAKNQIKEVSKIMYGLITCTLFLISLLFMT